MTLTNSYFKNLYQRTMSESYALAHDEIIKSLNNGGKCLDCGSSSGHKFSFLKDSIGLQLDRYHGIEWNGSIVKKGQAKGLNIIQGDLNSSFLFPDESFKCIFGLSVLEHLMYPCGFIKECYRCLEPGGTCVILTPNISTLFTIGLLLFGKMPSSGPYPDSNLLLKQEELFQVRNDINHDDLETDTPVHRHIIIFSYRVLKSYLSLIGFKEVRGNGFGLYPFPNFMQNILEKIDPYHCHQMVFIGKK